MMESLLGVAAEREPSSPGEETILAMKMELEDEREEIVLGENEERVRKRDRQYYREKIDKE